MPSTSASLGPRLPRPSRVDLMRITAVSTTPSLALRRHRNDEAGGIPVSPHVHVAVGDVVRAEDRAHMRPMIVAVVQRLDEHDTDVKRDPPLDGIRLDGDLGPDLRGNF